MIVEDKQERIKCSFIEIELPFQQEASCSSTDSNRFIRRKASLARKPRGSDMQPHLLKLGGGLMITRTRGSKEQERFCLLALLFLIKGSYYSRLMTYSTDGCQRLLLKAECTFLDLP